MAGLLQFTLGIATGSALSSLSKVGDKVKGLTGAALSMPGIGVALGGVVGGFTSLNHAVEKVFSQFEKGAALEHLHKRTGETVENLYKLQKGFAAAGVAGESVPTVVFQMQKALGGFNEFGEPTKDVFAAIRLEVEKLKGMSAPEALTTILGQIARLNNSEATNIAAKIFGRSGAGDALQLARSVEGVKAGMEGAAVQAGVFARNAAAFERIELGLKKLKNAANSVWLGIAAGAAPGVEAALKALNGLKLNSIGEKIGQAIGVGVQAIKDGELGELLSLSLQAGIEKAFNFMAGLFGSTDFWSGVGQTALGAFGALGTGLIKIFFQANAVIAALFEKTITEIIDKFTGGKLREVLGLEYIKPRGFAEIQQDYSGRASQMFTDMFGEHFNLAGDFMTDGAKDLRSSIAEAFKAANGGESGKKLAELFDRLLGRVPKGGGESDPADPLALKGTPDKVKAGRFKSQATELEKMGLLLGYGGAAPTDYQSRTASNTGQMVELLRVISRKINQAPTVQDYSNIA